MNPSKMNRTQLNTRFNDVAKNLEILAEECGEVVQIKSKCIRFGFDSKHPESHTSNATRLENELGDVFAMIRILDANDVINFNHVVEAAKKKLDKLDRFY